MKRFLSLSLVAANLAFALSLLAQPQFLYQPQDASVSLGADVFLYAPALGASEVSYQWHKDGAPLPDATIEMLVFSPVSLTDTGDYQLVATDVYGSSTSQVASIIINPDFIKITTGPIARDQGQAYGATWGDYDNDGWLDLFISHDQNTNNALLHNNGDGTFSRVSAGPVVSDGGDSYGGAWGDFNNDGWLDLHVPNFGPSQNQSDFLYRNQGNGTLDKITAVTPVQDANGTYGSAWADFDHDGWLDLAAINFPFYDGRTLIPANFIHLNNHDGTFRLLSNALPSLGFCVSAIPVVADFDNDRWPDLFVSSIYGPGFGLFRNQGNLQFNVVTGPWSSDQNQGWSAAFGDFDNDGFLDLFVPIGFNSVGMSYLCHNDGRGGFTLLTNGLPAGRIGNSSTAAWADYDNDGWLDLFVGDLGGRNELYHNNGDGTFTPITTGSLVTDQAASISCSWGDYDNDGFPDLVVANYERGSFLYRNAGNANAWLKVKCVGRESNRLGVGTKVRVQAAIQGRSFWQTREISAGNSSSASGLTADFGLGNATQAALVRIEWPSGADQLLPEVAARQTLTVTEPVWTLLPRNPGAGLGRDFLFTADGPPVDSLQLQWQFNGVDLPNATNMTLLVPAVSTNDLGGYRLSLRDPVTGIVAFTPVRQLRLAPLAVISPQPSPTNQTMSLGWNVTYQTGVSSLEPFWLQWYQNGVLLPNATNTSLAFSPVQPTNSGTFFLVVSNCSGSVTSTVVTLDLDPAFTKIFTAPMLTNVGSAYGSAWLDLPGQPYPALFVAHYNALTNSLFRYDGDGLFTRLMAPDAGALVAGSAQCVGVAVADFDNDGLEDVFVANNNGRGALFYQGRPDGTFLRLTNTLVATNTARSWAAAWADYDRDGWLDLFVANVDNDCLYKNTGTNGFLRLTNAVPALDGVPSRSGAWADYDNDGWPDLVVALGGTNCLYHNNGDGTFTSLTNSAIAAARGTSYSVAWGDYDNDGFPDLFLAGSGADFLFHNNGDGSFLRLTEGVVPNSGSNSYACGWADYDNDGWLDLFVANAGSDFLFHNNGDGSFTRILAGNPPNDGGDSRTCAWGDYDNDGFPDLFVGNSSGARFLYRNSGNSNHWLKVRCVGVRSNRSGIGVKVRLEATLRGTSLRQLREITTGDGLGGGSLVAMFGLGDAPVATTLRLEWPSGTVQEFHNVRADRFLTIKEDQDSLDTSAQLVRPTIAQGTFQFDLTGAAAGCMIQTSTNLRQWTDWLPLTNGPRPLTLTWSNLSTTPHLYFRAIPR